MPTPPPDPRHQLLATILARKPKLHYWPAHGGWSFGGFDDRHLKLIFTTLTAALPPESHTTLETGAGLSTLIFLATRPLRHVCIAPDEALRDRVLQQVDEFGLAGDRLEFVTRRSEEVLPALTETAAPFLDAALIDGGHGFPTPFVDFCYINRALKQGGGLFVDDTQLYSVRQLTDLLTEQPGWKTLTATGKLSVFHKQHALRYLPDFGEQPFVKRQSHLPGAAPVRQELPADG